MCAVSHWPATVTASQPELRLLSPLARRNVCVFDCVSSVEQTPGTTMTTSFFFYYLYQKMY